MLTFYYAPNSCALASHLALEHSGLAYEAKRLNFAENAQKSPAFLAVNPKGRVPALVTDEGVLTETPAILVYLSQLSRDANLAPMEDPFFFARLQSFNSYIASTVHVAHAHRYRGYRWSDDKAAIESMAKRVPQNMHECFSLIEQELLAGPWVMGEQYTVCDMYLFTICRWLPGDEVDINDFPKVADLYQRMQTLPAVVKIVAEHAAAS